MIDKRPTPGDITDWWLMDPYKGGGSTQPMMEYRPKERISKLLGPDGEPLLVPIQRIAVGFDLRPKAKTPVVFKGDE